MHNHNDKKSSGMMWMMLICCLLPVAILLFAGGTLSSGGYLWPVLFGVTIVAHLWMMFKGHGGHGDGDAEEESTLPAAPANGEHSGGSSTAETDTTRGKQPEIKDTRKHGGCCH